MSKLFLAACITVMLSGFCFTGVFAAEEGQQIPDKVTIEHWSCKEVAALATKYDAKKKLPDTVLMKGEPCSRKELADCFFAVIESVLEKKDRSGVDVIPGDDVDRIAKLHDSLQSELSGTEGYLNRREKIEMLLAAPAVAPFLLKAGVNGFFRGEGTGNFRLPDFSYTPDHSEGRFLYRIKPYAYWHPTDFLGIHLEVQGYGFSGGDQYSGKFSLYQGFVEASLPEKNLFVLKIGRQEFNFGSAFVLGSDSFYDGLTFDAARLRIEPLKALSMDLFGGWYATPFSDGLKGDLAGAYVSWAFSEGNVLEAYGLRDTGAEERQPGEHRDTWGLRGTARFGPVSLELEPVLQTGRTFNQLSGSNDSISTYGGHADLLVEVPLGDRAATLFLSYAISSGSGTAAAGISSRKEFQNPNNDSSLVGDMSVIGDLSGVDVNDRHASGLQIWNLGWGIDLTDKINISATGRYFLARDVPNGMSRNLGLETDITLNYAVNEKLSVIIGYGHFFTGRFFREASGRGGDIDYGYAMLQYDLAKTWKRIRKG
jgi:hypothetical protein